MTQPPREHLAEVYIVGTAKVGKRDGLVLLCSRCGGPDIFADGLTVAAVVAAGATHVERTGDPRIQPAADHHAHLAAGTEPQ